MRTPSVVGIVSCSSGVGLSVLRSSPVCVAVLSGYYAGMRPEKVGHWVVPPRGDRPDESNDPGKSPQVCTLPEL